MHLADDEQRKQRRRQTGIHVIHEQPRLSERSDDQPRFNKGRVARDVSQRFALTWQHIGPCRHHQCMPLAQGLLDCPDVGDSPRAPSRIACLVEDALDVMRILGPQFADLAFEGDRPRLANLELGALDEVAEVRLEEGKVRLCRGSSSHVRDVR